MKVAGFKHELAQLDHLIRTGQLYIAEHRRTIALAEREGRDCRRDRDLLAHLEAAQPILTAARERLLAS
jgi:hypothetical protein